MCAYICLLALRLLCLHCIAFFVFVFACVHFHYLPLLNTIIGALLNSKAACCRSAVRTRVRARILETRRTAFLFALFFRLLVDRSVNAARALATIFVVLRR